VWRAHTSAFTLGFEAGGQDPALQLEGVQVYVSAEDAPPPANSWPPTATDSA